MRSENWVIYLGVNSFSEELYIPILLIHIISGGLALLIGSIILFRKKGDALHKSFGMVFVYSMISSCFAALVLSLLKSNVFLFLIGFLTLYMIATGVRYQTVIRRRVKARRVKWTDWTMTVLLGIFSIFLTYLSIVSFLNSKYFGMVFVMFAAIGYLMIYQDFINLRGKAKVQNFGLLMHIQRMTGSYIASLTAFLVVNITFLPGFIIWILPTMSILPFIIRWTRKYKKLKKSRYSRLQLDMQRLKD